jgi:hypothetical protein
MLAKAGISVNYLKAQMAALWCTATASGMLMLID